MQSASLTQLLQSEQAIPLVTPRTIAAPRPAYLFVDNIRFLSLISIMLLHSCNVLTLIPQMPDWVVQLVDVPFKFGTYGFFLSAGFLSSRTLGQGEALPFFRNRIARIGFPALFWILLCALSCAVYGTAISISRGPSQFAVQIFLWLQHFLLASPYWFVPNLLFSTAVLLVFRRFLYDLRFGAVLLTIDLLYVANLYTNWWPITYQQALLGFTFELWLGAYAARHVSSLQSWVRRTPAWVFVAAISLFGVASFLESRMITALASADPTDTMRLSNQLLAVTLALGLMKVPRGLWPGLFQVRRYTFGMFLVQPAVLAAFHIPLHHLISTWSPRTGLGLAELGFAACVLKVGGVALASFVVVKAFAANDRTARLIGIE